MFTAYELMERRFGPRVRKVTSAIFLVTRSLAEGVRVFAISIVISIILHTSGPRVDSGDRRADPVLYVRRRHDGRDLDRCDPDGHVCPRARASVFLFSLGKIPGGFGACRSTWPAPRANCRSSISTGPGPPPIRFWAGMIGGCFLTTASHGTDQLVVQRLLSAQIGSAEPPGAASQLGRDLRAILAVPHHRHAAVGLSGWPAVLAKSSSTGFILRSSGTRCPAGIAGLAMAAIIAAAMANLSAALNSLASATVVDFYRPLTALALYTGTLSDGFAPLHHLLGWGPGGHRRRREPLGFRAGIRALHCLRHAGDTAGGVSAGRAHQTAGQNAAASQA